MPPPPASRDITGQFILLGTGTSVGVPVLGCDCAVCRSDNPRNRRTRCAALLGLPGGNLLIDTPPDLRTQLLREGVGVVHAVAYTHEHADHLFGLDDLRLMQFYLGGPVPLYCETRVARRIEKSYDYAFAAQEDTHVGARPKLEIRPITAAPFEALGARVTPIRLEHGPRFSVLGFRVGSVAYCTDVSAIPAASWQLLAGLDVLILDALRHEPHSTHFSLDQAVAAAERCGAKRTYFTHCSHEFDYDAVNAQLPSGMELAYDGLRIELT
ncbi:MAG: MBL fold metallo-hydrolase [Planctomycetales bacterium]|nr:MBL fold metallo-hydrolase [Planctomycetales bacterium]